MPWTAGDVDRFKKGLSSAGKSKWVAIANGILKDGGDEAKAIRIANARVREAEDDYNVRDDIEREKRIAAGEEEPPTEEPDGQEESGIDRH